MVLGLPWDNWYVTVRTDPDAWSFLTCEEDFYTLTIESKVGTSTAASSSGWGAVSWIVGTEDAGLTARPGLQFHLIDQYCRNRPHP